MDTVWCLCSLAKLTRTLMNRDGPKSLQADATPEGCAKIDGATTSTIQVPDQPMNTLTAYFCSHAWRRFLPAIIVYPIWFYIMMTQDAWSESFGTYYPLTIAMIPGSMIAGSTPLGGGVVAFPLTVLVIKFMPTQGRDFSLIIQSVGMTAASFLIMYSKPRLCHVWLILWCLLSAIGGMIVGFRVSTDGFAINVIYTTSIACFALAYLYRNIVVNSSSAAPGMAHEDHLSRVPKEAGKLLSSEFDLQSNPISAFFGRCLPAALTAGMCVFGFVGGLLSSKLGSGADMLAYMFGVFVWNSSVPKGAELPDNMLTASSVLIMAGCSIVGTLLRVLSEGMSREVMLCWGACVPVVVLGAPVGSLLLTPRRTGFLRRCFYVLALIQFATFGILKIKGNLLAWMCTLGALVSQALGLALHYVFIARKGQQIPSEP